MPPLTNVVIFYLYLVGTNVSIDVVFPTNAMLYIYYMYNISPNLFLFAYNIFLVSLFEKIAYIVDKMTFIYIHIHIYKLFILLQYTAVELLL